MCSLVKHANKFLLFFLVCFFLFPLISAISLAPMCYPLQSIVCCLSFDASSVFTTWDRWQTIIAGMLALLASIFGLKIAQIKDEETSKRKYLARKALLSHAFANLTAFLRKAEDYYIQCFINEYSDPVVRNGSYSAQISTEYKETILNVMEYAPNEKVRIFLSQILNWMQIDTSRLRREDGTANFSFDLLIDILAFHYYIDKNFIWARELNELSPILDPPTIDGLFTLLTRENRDKTADANKYGFEAEFKRKGINRGFSASG